MTDKLIITPKTRIRELIDAYPEAEETLISMAPAFSKLRNTVLRNTVARVTSLSQAALIANLDVAYLVNCLRQKVGQVAMVYSPEADPNSIKAPPAWFNKDKVTATLDARPLLEAGLHPFTEVFENLSKLESGSIFELISGFIPAPLIDKARLKGYHAYPVEESVGEFHTYFIRQ